MDDPVTASVLAEALREAATTTDDLFERGVFDGGESMKAARMIHRWQSILDRYDAQVVADLKEMMSLAITHRDRWMQHAHMARNWEWAPHFVKSDIDDARSNNWTYIRLRRQLRALGGES